MEWLARIFDWLREQEAGFSAMAAILVIAGVLFAGVRLLLQRGAGQALKKALARSSRRTVLIAAGAGALLILAGVAAWLLLPNDPEIEVASEEDAVLALPTGPVVAVLPFENLSEDPKQEFFSDGLTDGIITALSRFKDLFVIARNSTFRYKGQPIDVRKLREELGARYVVEGSVQKAGDTLRVTAQLLDAKDGTHLWANSYDRELSATSVFAVQDDITERVVATIAGPFGVISRAQFSEIKEKPTESLDAYEWVLKASAYHRDNYVAPENKRLRDGLEGVVKSDPGYADAWASLSFVYLDAHKYNYKGRSDPLGRSLEAARRAVTSAPTSQRAHDALANVYFFRHELDLFLAEAERAIALNPTNASTLGRLGTLFVNAGNARGIKFVRKAMALDPFHPTWFYFPIAIHHFDRAEYEEALEAASKIDVPGDYWHPLLLTVSYTALGRQSDASSALEELLRLAPGFTIKKYIEEERKWNRPDAAIEHWAAALRKAGLPE